MTNFLNMRLCVFVFALVGLAYAVPGDTNFYYNRNRQNGYNENSIQVQPQTWCRTQRCPQNCNTYIGQDGCMYCGPCQQVQRQNRCPPVNCHSYPGMKCYTATDRNGCKTCRCEKVRYPACPMPMCSANCNIVADAEGCYHCKCHENLNCPPLPRTCGPNCDRYRGPDGCEHCDCAKVAMCPEVKCDFSRCRHKIDFKTGCATGCECLRQPTNNAGFRTQPR